MDRKMIRAADVEAESPAARQDKPRLDGSRFHDERRRGSSEVSRAFTSAIRAASRGPQSEMSAPDEVSLGPAATDEMEVVRGVD